MKVKAVLFDYDDTLMDVNDAREYARESVAVRISEMCGIDKALIMSALKDTEAHMESLGIFNRKPGL
ncbi:MAG: HAD family hydrolase, partial [Vulcanisaeta sp.]